MILAATFVFSSAVAVFADQESDLKEQKAAAEAELYNTNATLDDLAYQQEQIREEISDANADLVDLMVQISQAEQDIEMTKGMIEETESAIRKTRNQLKTQNALKDEQYDDMVTRICYIYENGGQAAWATLLFNSGDLESFLNKAEYTSELQKADRAALEDFAATIEKISNTEEELKEEKENEESQKANLEAQQKGLEEQHADLEVLLADLEATSDNYEVQIAEARAQATAIQELINRQTAEIARIQEEKRREEERRRAEEEARRRAEEEARRAAEERAAEEERARAAAAEEAARAAAEEAAAEAGDDADYEEVYDEVYEETYEDTYDEPEETYEEEASTPSYSSGSGSGYGIVSFADQFVGNRYVYGGNSLTGGIDCSHFVYQVLSNCGVYSGPYLTSGEWAYAGRSVSSLAEAQAGDVIVYSGHVGIYDGSGMIVEAKGTQYGITHDRAADCKQIVAIRRFT